jgi:ParB/RepB/Spo0J family partition protein
MATNTTTDVATAIIPLDRIHADGNVRRTLPNIDSLAASIRRDGVLSAITVTRREDGDYDLVTGFRRVAAATKADLDGIPAIVRDRGDDAERVRQRLSENIDRVGLADLDQGAAIQQLLDLGVSAETIADTVHTTPANVQAWADLLRLPRKVRTLIDKGRLTAADAYPLVSLLDDTTSMREALDRIDSGWPVDEAVTAVRRAREQEQALTAARQTLEAEGTRIVDAPQWGSFSSTSKTRRLGKGHADVHISVRAHAKFACHAAYISQHENIVYVCTNRNAHAGVEGTGVPDLKLERAAKRAQKKTLREAHILRFGLLRDAVRNHAIGTDETVVAHILRLSIDNADHRDHVTAAAMLELAIPDGGGYTPERDALIAHAESSESALFDVALSVAIAHGERSLASEHFDGRRATVAEHVRFIRATGLHEFSDVEETLIQERTPRRWDSEGSDESADAA